MFDAQRPPKAANPPLVQSSQNPPVSFQQQSNASSALSLNSIRKCFGATVVLDALSLEVPQGSICGIIGRSGAGKTTLIRIAGLLDRPDSGAMFHFAHRVEQLSGSCLVAARRRAGFIFQGFNLFASRTVGGNVAFPLEAAGWSRRDAEDRVSELLDLVGLSDKVDRPTSRLSGGERQRVAIARALANNPGILFSDEATSALDPETTRSVLELLRSLRDRLGLTIVMVTHQLEVVRRICDDVAVIAQGRIVEHGPCVRVLRNPDSDSARRLVREAMDA